MPRYPLLWALTLFFLLVNASVASSAHFGYRPLERGMAGEDVEELQRMLSQMGHYRASIDGIFGPVLEQSVKKLQGVYGLKQTGRLDGKMLEIATVLWNAYISGEEQVLEINPAHVRKDGQKPQLYVHTITRGETLYSIARRYGTSVGLIIRMNEIQTPDRVFIGQKIYILTYK